MLNLPVETWLRFVVWMVVGLVVYFAYGVPPQQAVGALSGGPATYERRRGAGGVAAPSIRAPAGSFASPASSSAGPRRAPRS